MSIQTKVRMIAAQPPELIVYDEPGDCSYIDGRVWRLPLRLPVRPLTRSELDSKLDGGDRRQGRLLYRTACPECRACEPIRLDVAEFHPTRTQRRVLARGSRLIETEVGRIEVSRERVRLYNLHKRGRNLAAGEGLTRVEAYRAFLGDSCCETFEMRYRVAGELMGVAIVDRGERALSAVYFYWNPKFAALSPGAFSIMKQVELCRRLGMQYLYLGLYISDCYAMSYKGAFLPHERLVDSRWQRFDRRAHDDYALYQPPPGRPAPHSM